MFLALDLENWSEEEVANENLFHLFDFNRAWSSRMQEIDPEYFLKLSRLQTPQYLWIGCSDSRVPANEIVGLLPGEVFVHRNVANVVVHTDLNCLSVIQFAVDVLKVRHIMVVGHYGCGGVKAALNRDRAGLVDIWLRHVRDVHDKHLALVDALPPSGSTIACANSTSSNRWPTSARPSSSRTPGSAASRSPCTAGSTD
jgi:carbonic anhydrase